MLYYPNRDVDQLGISLLVIIMVFLQDSKLIQDLQCIRIMMKITNSMLATSVFNVPFNLK